MIRVYAYDKDLVAVRFNNENKYVVFLRSVFDRTGIEESLDSIEKLRKDYNYTHKNEMNMDAIGELLAKRDGDK